MSKLSESNEILATLESQRRKTIEVISAIKGYAEGLIEDSDQITAKLSEETLAAEEAAIAVAEEIEVEAMEEEVAAAIDAFDQDWLIDQVSKRCVKEVMATINPVLVALQQFIEANSIDTQQTAEIDDEAFAEKLIEEMKVSLGRRQKIALARKRLTSP
ncbi:hypothetical protein [Actibacterium lipolyticum]|uniref:Uncharacterized protein n=1 Tax=Actibacterium lipolyticum TaxID=1524263 RepID=A0A238KM43_9RHOB|nr:hypothetical protein [Actibacterium lipolyticum]SMX43106.1 hypothetical protein COL8621_02215 [Actibacterium lipolyticum]